MLRRERALRADLLVVKEEPEPRARGRRDRHVMNGVQAVTRHANLAKQSKTNTDHATRPTRPITRGRAYRRALLISAAHPVVLCPSIASLSSGAAFILLFAALLAQASTSVVVQNTTLFRPAAAPCLTEVVDFHCLRIIAPIAGDIPRSIPVAHHP